MPKIRLIFSVFMVGSLFTQLPAYAAPIGVSYFTTGTFTGGSTPGTSVYTSGGLTIAYTGVTALNPNVSVGPADPSNTSFGSFQVTGAGTVTGTFSLFITQITPGTAASESFVSDSNALDVHITITSSSSIVRFLSLATGAGGPATEDTDPESFVPAQKFTLDGIDYWVDDTTKLNPQNTLSGRSSIVGAVDAAVPEPDSCALTCMGLAGIAAVRRRRNRS